MQLVNTIDHSQHILTLNLGLGRDSFAMLCLLLEGKLIADGAPVRVQDVTAVVCSDTGHEWTFTYDNLPLASELCRQAGLRFIHLRKPPADGEKGWKAWLYAKQSQDESPAPFWRDEAPASIEDRASSGYYHLRPPILDDYQSRCTTISLKRQDCTGNHKVLPIRRLLEDLAHALFGVESNAAWGREVRKGLRPPHWSMIGYAADEVKRFEDLPETGASYVREVYPLVELGISKAEEQPILQRWNLDHVRKSGCFLCPFQPVGWYWALSLLDPVAWEQILEYERRSLSRNPRMTVLPGGTPLPEAVSRWRARNPDATVDAILDKQYSRCRQAHEDEGSFAALHDACDEAHPLMLFVRARVLLHAHARLES